MNDTDKNPCRLFEIEQYICEIEDKNNSRVRCYPLPRIFRICQGRPAVEVTALAEINPKTGELNVPDNLTEILPKGRAWGGFASAPKYPGKDL
ncbi:hypothetical protein JB92DRAFT_2703684 [Gautieria morchelliformis]|nr:hypothetical protein JB92DRAFT_2703684 [Gautieria morchelliformis]